MKIEIESNENYPLTFDVRHDGKIAESLTFDEMLGLTVQLAMPEKRRCLAWLKPIVPEVSEDSTDEITSIQWYHDKKFELLSCFVGDRMISLDYEMENIMDAGIDERDCEGLDEEMSTGQVLCFLARRAWVDGWNAAREFCGMDEAEAYVSGQSACEIKDGDLVFIERKPTSLEMGWSDVCLEQMEGLVGKHATVASVWHTGGFELGADGLYFAFPYFVLTNRDPSTNDDAVHTDYKAISTEPVIKVDLGEGYRLVGSDEPIEPGDDFYSGLQWEPTSVDEENRGCQIGRAIELQYRRKIIHTANVGDWIRSTVSGYETRYLVHSTNKGYVSVSSSHGVIHFTSGSYDVVRQVVKPWTMEEACRALAETGMKIVARKPWLVLEVRNVRSYGIGCKEGHSPTFEQLTYLLDPSKPELGQAWTLLDGSPCGNVVWEAV